MELICPSCEARYEVPGAAIGEKGRQVSCLNCGHSWHAYPPLVLEAQDAPKQAVPSWKSEEEKAAPAGAGASRLSQWTAPEDDLSDSSVAKDNSSDVAPIAPPPASASRHEQLAEIREMLAEVQTESRATAAIAPGAAGAAAVSAATQDRALGAEPSLSGRSADAPRNVADLDRGDPIDTLREKLSQKDVQRMAPPPPDTRKLRRAHARKEAHRRRREAQGSGAFLTGFLLVVVVAAIMVALYLLHPQIIARMPGTEPALTEYVATIDGWRVGVSETFGGLTDWVVDKFKDAE